MKTFFDYLPLSLSATFAIGFLIWYKVYVSKHVRKEMKEMKAYQELQKKRQKEMEEVQDMITNSLRAEYEDNE